jgi:peptide deformylase
MAVDTLPVEIIKYPDPRLRRKAAPIEEFDDSVSALAQRMLELMHTGRGVGLAAPQVGISQRVIVCNPTGEPEDDLVLINPVLSELLGAVEAEEGCLSVPEVLVKVRRGRKCRVDAYDVQGNPFAMEGEDLLARIWQHEVDHLDGRLIIDRMNETDKIAYKKRLADLEAEYRRKSRKR